MNLTSLQANALMCPMILIPAPQACHRLTATLHWSPGPVWRLTRVTICLTNGLLWMVGRSEDLVHRPMSRVSLRARLAVRLTILVTR